jgi:phosphoserine phosphatase RsbU/P
MVEPRVRNAGFAPPAAGSPGAPAFSMEPLAEAETPDSSSPLDDVLQRAARHCQRLVQASVVRIWIARRGGSRLVSREFDGDGRHRDHRMGRGQGLAGWAMTTGEPLHLRAGGARPVLSGRVPEFRSALVVPVFRRGAAFGALECLDPRHGGDFSDADFEQLVIAAEPIALAIDNALLVEQAERRALEKEVLLEISRTLSAPLELDDVIEVILRSLRQVVDYDAAAIYLVRSEVTNELELVREIGYPAGSEDAFRLQMGQGIVGWVAKTSEAAIVPDVARDPRYVVARVETRSELAAPLVVEGRTIGVFNLESDLEDAYHEGHLEIVRAFAAQAAVAVERARLTGELVDQRRLERELAIARDIQKSFLPAGPPELEGFELAGTTRSHDEVGGDYFDFIRISDTRLGLAIADVSGKGIPAGLIMAGFRMCLLAEIRNEFAIRAIMRKVNSLIHESTDRGKFVTAFYGLLDTKNRVVIFSNAGHNPPILWRRGNTVEYLEEGGVALGVLPDAHYEDRPMPLRTGDVLVMFTDGVTEAESPSREHFGSGRVEACVARLADRSAAEILEGIVASVIEWCGDAGPSDDLTLVVLKVTDESA